MPAVIKFLPHPQLCPEGKEVVVEPGISLCQLANKHGVPIEHACEMSCACTTCHVYIRKNLESVAPASELEEDMLDKAWGLEPESRLSCQCYPGEQDLEVEIPRYTINIVSEG